MISFPGKALWDRLEKAEAERDAALKKLAEYTIIGPRHASDCDHPLECRTTAPGDAVFEPRVGCLLCNTWIDPVQLRRP